MSGIKILDENLINKIAAGEVIERPASVIKELVENSIDANSTKILIDIDSDLKSLKIEDNGDGMDKDDLRLSIHRHATSKISGVDDLFNINSLGFRGEAMSSIAAVSKMTIYSKQKDEEVGNRLIFEEGESEIKEVGVNDGTTIEVKNLFYNTPVRKKFLRSSSKEISLILDIISRFALFYHKITFKLSCDGKVMFKSIGSDDPINPIISVYGKDYAKDMEKVNGNIDGIKIEGFVSKPILTRSNKNMQTIFVNGRNIKNKIITDAIYAAYHTLLFNDRHPIVVLKIEIDPKIIDVNVHPTKKEIRIEDEEKIFDAIKNAVRSTLDREAISDNVDKKNYDVQKTLNFNAQTHKVFESDNKYYTKEFTDDFSQQQILAQDHIRSKTVNSTNEEKYEFKVLGQINRCFIIASKGDGFIIVDQHTCEERINYDKLMKQLMNKNIKKQTLISPLMINLNHVDSLNLKDNLKLVKEYGFDIEEFGDNTFRITSIPIIFSRSVNKDVLIDMIDDFNSLSKTKKIENLQEKIITKMACRASVKRGDPLTIIQMNDLLINLFNSSLPNTCPHGRPIIIDMNMHELEKMFKRK